VTAASAEFGDETVVWRYMDLARFAVLLSESKLHFTRGSALRADDPYEIHGRAEGLERPVQRVIPAEQGSQALYALMSHEAASSVNNASEHVFVNSWCMASESLGMWMLYGASGRGVAVRSTIGRVKAAIKRELDPDQYRFGAVEYDEERARAFDFRQGTIPVGRSVWKVLLTLALTKRLAYQHEREWRAAIYQDSRQKAPGIDIPVDLDVLLEQVYAGPRATAVDRAALEAVLGLGNVSPEKVTRSTLLDGPA
jgi:hypothetical protein